MVDASMTCLLTSVALSCAAWLSLDGYTKGSCSGDDRTTTRAASPIWRASSTKPSMASVAVIVGWAGLLRSMSTSFERLGAGW